MTTTIENNWCYSGKTKITQIKKPITELLIDPEMLPSSGTDDF